MSNQLKVGTKLRDDRNETSLFIEIIEHDVKNDLYRIAVQHWAASFLAWTTAKSLLSKARIEDWTPEDVKGSVPYRRANKYG